MIHKFLVILMASQFAIAAKAQYSDNYEYTLNFELDSRTGKYRPAYNYNSTKGSSTIWLDGANKNKTAAKKNEEKILIAFKWPASWKVTSNIEKAMAMHSDSSCFSVYASRSFTDVPSGKDIVEEWYKRCRTKYGDMSEKDILSGQFKNGGVYYMYVKAGKKGAALALIYSGKRVVPVLLEFPSADLFRLHRQELRDFLESIEVKKGVIYPA